MIEKPTADLVLLTNKNRDATISLSSHFGLMISDDNIYSGDHGTTKIDNMTADHAAVQTAGLCLHR